MAFETHSTGVHPGPEAGFVADLELRVTGGLHAGANAALQNDAVIIVGRDSACDLRLMDEGVEDRHFALLVNGPEPELRPFTDALLVNGKRIAAERMRLTIPCTLRLGPDCSVIIDTAQRSSQAIAPRSRRSPQRLAWLLSAAFVVLGLAAYTLPRTSEADTELTPSALRAAIVAELAGFPDGAELSVTAHGTQLVVSGVVASAVRGDIVAALAAHRPSPVVNLISDDELVAQVQEVFASNGYEAAASYAGQASVRISNLDGANPAVMRVAEHARRDVTGLRELSVLPAPVEVDDTTLSMADLGGSKRLSRIVDGETAYLASTDGGRYFVGSILPSGHRLRQITKEAVQLDREGRLEWVRF